VCTAIVGLHVLGPGTVVFGANRDESPDRPTAGPGILIERPRVVGGRDLRSGGTWLAVRDARFISALMNRRLRPGPHSNPPTPRSRGLLCLDAAATPVPVEAPAAIDPGTGEAHTPRLDAALRLVRADRYADCTLLGVEAEGAWAIRAGPGAVPDVAAAGDGWHVITHQDLDDRSEPRTAWLLERLEGARPRDVESAFALLAGLLRRHGDDGAPPVCLHRERFPTISSSLLALGDVERPRYLHASGPPCVTPYEDYSALLT
jgi:hypothetical protein